MILLSVIAILASFPTAGAEGIAVQQDTIKKVRRLDIKKLEENSVPLQLKIEKEEDKTIPPKPGQIVRSISPYHIRRNIGITLLIAL